MSRSVFSSDITANCQCVALYFFLLLSISFNAVESLSLPLPFSALPELLYQQDTEGKKSPCCVNARLNSSARHNYPAITAASVPVPDSHETSLPDCCAHLQARGIAPAGVNAGQRVTMAPHLYKSACVQTC